MLPTPSTSHVNFDKIYEPAEDSFLLVDTLAAEESWLKAHFPPSKPTPLLVEIGPGSGVVIAFLTANAPVIFGRAVVSMGIDINEYACTATEITVEKAISEQNSPSCYLGSICGNLSDPLLAHSVDVLVFNPPYVPTADLPSPVVNLQSNSNFELESHLLSLSYAGGIDGMGITKKLLATLTDVLSATGVAYILLCAQNKPEEVKAMFETANRGWQAKTIGRSGKKAGWEKLEIIRIWKQT